MKINRNLSQIRAEVLLNYLYPGMEEQWTAHCRGTFFRNYNEDVLELEENSWQVSLSRDGFLRMLPEGLLTNDNDLKGEDKAERFKELQWRRELLSEAFSPFDTYVFRRKLSIERQVSELLESKLEYLLKEYFGFDLQQETNAYVREAAVLLPFVSRWRGDFGFIGNLLEALMSCKVEMTMGRYSHTDSSVNWLPRVRYSLLIPDLSPEQYREMTADMQPLCDFIQEWLIPFEVVCEIRIKEHRNRKDENVRLTLDYNTELEQ